MRCVPAFCGKMENVGWIRQIASNPVLDLLAETAPDSRFVSSLVRRAQFPETGMAPSSHGYFDRILIHGEIARFAEMEAALPCIAETIWPLSRVTIFLMWSLAHKKTTLAVFFGFLIGHFP